MSRDLAPIVDHLRDRLGVDLAGVDSRRLAGAVEQRMAAAGAADPAAYAELLRAQPAEAGRLLDALLADRSSLDWTYDVYPRIEEPFLAALDESLDPRGPELLYEMVDRLGLPAGARAADVGCGEGRHSVGLAERFGFEVVGIDPVARHLELARRALAGAAGGDPSLANRVRFVPGDLDALPLDDAAVDLVWCRDVLEHVHDLDRAFAEMRRVLRPGGRALVYSMFRADRPPSDDVDRLWMTMGNAPGSADPDAAERAMAIAGLRVAERVVLGSEWGEHAEERAAGASRRLLHAARLLREPERYVERFGQAAYDVMLADCSWHVHRMLGRLSGRVYLLAP